MWVNISWRNASILSSTSRCSHNILKQWVKLDVAVTTVLILIFHRWNSLCGPFQFWALKYRLIGLWIVSALIVPSIPSRIGGGSTRFGASLLSQIKNRTIESRMSKYSIELYKQLQDMGHQTGWKQCGSLHLARTKERYVQWRAVTRHICCNLREGIWREMTNFFCVLEGCRHIAVKFSVF